MISHILFLFQFTGFSQRKDGEMNLLPVTVCWGVRQREAVTEQQQDNQGD